MFACYTISFFSSYSISFLFILLFSISFCFHLYIRSLNLIHSLCIAPVHSCWHVGVHLLRGFSHRTFTRNFVNAIRFWLWLIFAILRRLLIFSALYLNHRSILDSIVSDQCHMRCHSLMVVLWPERLYHDCLFVSLLQFSIECQGPRLGWETAKTFFSL